MKVIKLFLFIPIIFDFNPIIYDNLCVFLAHFFEGQLREVSLTFPYVSMNKYAV